MRIGNLEFVIHWRFCEDPQGWQERCKKFLRSLNIEDLPIPEAGSEAEQLQELSDWVWKAFVESVDPREHYRREFLSIEVRRIRR